MMDTQEPQLASSEPHTATEVPRAAIIKRIAVALGGLSAAGAAAAGLASASGSSGSSLSSRDREVLEFALKFEQLQAAFYGQALKAGKLTGQIKQFAEVVGGEERAHLHYLERQLGGAAGSPPTFSVRRRNHRQREVHRRRGHDRGHRPGGLQRPGGKYELAPRCGRSPA